MSFDITTIEYGVLLGALVVAANVAEEDGDGVAALAIRSTLDTLTSFGMLTRDVAACPLAQALDEITSLHKQNCGTGAKSAE